MFIEIIPNSIVFSSNSYGNFFPEENELVLISCLLMNFCGENFLKWILNFSKKQIDEGNWTSLLFEKIVNLHAMNKVFYFLAKNPLLTGLRVKMLYITRIILY